MSMNNLSSEGRWLTLESKYLFNQPPWLTVRKDTVRMPGGHIIPDYFVLEYPDWINVLGVTASGEFLLISQYRYAFGQANYELCAGVIDESDTSPMDGAKRELLEETGYGGGDWREWLIMSPNPATSTNRVHCFLATGLEKLSEPTPEASEDISVHLFSYDELRTLLTGNGIMQATHLASIWKYMAMGGPGSPGTFKG
jgi:ADP-ribose pyrophosphatase